MPKKIIKRTARTATAFAKTGARRSLKTTKVVASQFRYHAATAIIAAFSFLIALVWKDFIVAIVEDLTKTLIFDAYPYLATLITAIIVTIVAIIGLTLVSRWAKKPESGEQTPINTAY